MSSNSGAWGVAMWRDDSDTQANGISLEGGDPIVPYLPTEPLGCLLLPPEGLGVPGQRVGDVTFAQTDGIGMFEDFYENRFITLRVSVCNDGCPGCPTGRAKVKRLLREWSRTCTGATLAIFTDCHDDSVGNEQRAVTGPFLVRGRPRIAEVTWLRSNFGCAQVLLRFDSLDHRLVILPIENDLATPWTGTLCETVEQEVDGSTGSALVLDGVSPGRAQTPDTASLDIVGDIDLRVLVALDDWTPANAQGLVAKWVTSGNQRSYLLRVEATTGTLRLFWTPDGSTVLSATSTAAPLVANGNALWVRATLDVDNGAAGRTVTFYTSPATDGVTWTQLGSAVTTAGVTSIFNSTAEASVGAYDTGSTAPVSGRIFGAQVLNGIAGTVVANPQFRDQAAGTTSFVDSTGKTWTVVSPAVIEAVTAIPTVVGDLCAFPVFTLTGLLTTPITIYYDGVATLVYSDTIAAIDDPVVIDTRYTRAFQGGEDVTANLSGTLAASLALGTTVVTMTSGSAADTGSIEMCWENAVISG